MTDRVRRLLVSAGELSGEQHAARLIAELKRREPSVEIDAWGGDLMAEAGATLRYPLSRHAVLGFAAVFKAIGTFAGILRRFADDLETRRPDAVILVDYPGLHLKFAQLARAAGVPVFYYCCPQFWAWAPWRGRRFARRVDHAFTIFPFEEAYFRGLGTDARYVGHPAADRLSEDSRDADDLELERRISAEPLPIALLPGSRPQEVRSNLPWMIAVAKEIAAALPDTTFFVPQLRVDSREVCANQLGADPIPRCRVIDRVTPLLRSARFALVASGTATFEVGFFGVPMVVVYRITRFQEMLGRCLLTVPWISQINLIAGREVVPEFVSATRPIASVTAACLDLIRDGGPRDRLQHALRAELRPAFAPGAAGRTAEAILSTLAPAASRPPR